MWLEVGVCFSGSLDPNGVCIYLSSDRTARRDVSNMRAYISFLPSKIIILVGKLHQISVDPVPLKREISSDENEKILNGIVQNVQSMESKELTCC